MSKQAFAIGLAALFLTEFVSAADPASGDHEADSQTATESPHWSFRSITRPHVPEVTDAGWVNNDIDRFVWRELARHSLVPSQQASRSTLIRRVYLDLIGLPPTPSQVREFVEDDSPNAYERLVDHLLDSPHFGERWGRHWLDYARYADSEGYDIDQPRPHAWRYRHWVVEALNRDLPFDQFTIYQLAGDLVEDPTVDQLVATGFHRNTLHNTEAGADPVEDRFKRVFDRTETTATVWLGLTMSCARCHDHKYDPISQREYYQMFAFFNDIWEKDVPAPLPHELEAYPPKKAEFDEQLKQLLDTRRNYRERIAAAKAKRWESQLPPIKLADWRVLKPEHLSAAKTEELVVQEDLSVLATGPTVEDTSYTVVATTDLPVITGIRLEVLPHVSLPNNGPGRAPNGDFDLTSFVVSAEPVPGDRPSDTKVAKARTLDLIHPAATHSREGRAFRDALGDRGQTQGWSIGDQTGKRHVAVAELRTPLKNEGGTRLTFTLRQGQGGWFQVIGRFRLSVTGTAAPFRVRELPGRPADYLAAPAQQRLEEHKREILSYFCSRDEHWLTLTRAVNTRLRLAPPDPNARLAQTVAELDEPRVTCVLDRGEFLRPLETVERGTPSVLPPLKPRGERADRLDLARWIVDPANPLTARVTVNRVWQQYFGRGLVASDDDFGLQGTSPSHPELLDWLASEFVERGWSLKRLHKLILMSATYRQSSVFRPELVDQDPYNELLARQQRVRVDAEIVRDLGLSVSGLLNPQIGGPSVVLPQPAGQDSLSFNRSQPLKPDWGANLFRRGIYVWFQRTAPYPGLMIFDASHNNATCTRRKRSITPMQALLRMNDPFYYECARGLATRILSDVPDDEDSATDRRLQRMYQVCLSRGPRDDEWPELRRLYEEHRAFYNANPELAREVTVNLGVKPDDVERLSELATWVVLSRIVINLDEFIVRQ